ncbi:hypothetical protein CJD36_022645 [Flavipsychrobacter stenotrophus]|uniref:Outer membrane protein beta-barrel domain-containing protein n=1 Tax=Flavipsychrobacter stenotrophus TaxID=2077091 RepID=A0A2S7SPU6_9BACT|nr:hypothetical protein [Flavipsychrobacter stenotrophus]PQJ08764.1 hypothetical protein CJD36_022645 [Flavipsychrobacter stenotrophus]
MKQMLCTLLLCAGLLSVSAQDVYNSSGKANGYRKKEQKGYDPAKLVIGGGLNAGLSSGYANFGISPKVGYKLTDFLAVGVGLGYQYYKIYDYTLSNNQEQFQHYNIVFPGVWAKCMVYNPIFIATDFEYDITNIRYYVPDYSSGTADRTVRRTQSVTAACLLVGAGYKQSLGGRTSATFEIMYDVLQADYSPYKSQLVYRAGIYVGL